MAKTKAKKPVAKKAPAAKKVVVSKEALAKAKAIAPTKGAVPKVSPLAPGMQWVNPYLSVKDPAAAIAFYEKAFGFATKFKMADKEGKIQHAELTHKTGTIMLGPECPERGGVSPATLKGTTVGLCVYVDNVDATVLNAKNAGAKIVEEPKDQFWGDRMASVQDPDGHRWCFMTHVKDVSPEDMAQGCSQETCH